jgi:hypothetical protein
MTPRFSSFLVAAALASSSVALAQQPPAAPPTAKPDAKPPAKPDAKPPAKPEAPPAKPDAKPPAKPEAPPAKPADPKPPAKPADPAPPAKPGDAKAPLPPPATPPAKPEPPAGKPGGPTWDAPSAPAAGPTAGAAIDKATPKQKQDAGTAFNAGMTLFDTNKAEEAIAKFRESYAIVASPNSRMMIARSLSKLGRNIEAYREALATLDEANALAATNDKYKATASGVADDIREIEKKIALVTVKITGEPDEATLSVAGVTIEQSQWAKAIPLNPGNVEVVLKTADGVSKQTVAAAAGAHISVTLEMPKAKVADAKIKPVEKKTSSWKGPDRKIMGYVALGSGGAALLLFGTFGALSSGQYSRLDSGCPARVNCDPSLQSVADRGKNYQTVANVSLGLGLVGVAAGVGFIVWDKLDGGSWPWESASAARTRFAVGPGSVELTRSF